MFDIKNLNTTKINQKNIKIMILLVVILSLLLGFGLFRERAKIITHTQANVLYSENKIERVIVDGEYIRFETREGNYKIYKEAINKTAFFSKYPVEVEEDKQWVYEVFSLLLIVMGFGFFYRLIEQSKHSVQTQVKSVSKEEEKSEYEPVEALTSTVRFTDVAGIKDVKEELEEIIDFLKEPQKYRDLDIRLPKGVLLVGPPGVGKTLISKAVAGEAGVPFFYQSGASFVHIYVGMGAKRVSELFQKAKQMAPSIIFIDEVDAVGKSRGAFRNDEREATLNQLLTEMDGFEESLGVIVIAATNKVEMLDDALLRAGRFDRRIHIGLPDLEDRAKTLELYLAHKTHDVEIEKIAKMTIGFNAAALDTLTNEAAIHSMRAGRASIQMADFEAVKEKVLQGKRKLRSFTEEEREIQAIYQASKAIVATWLDIEFEKIGIVTTDFTMLDNEILSKTKLLSRIKVYLAGSIATKLHYNEQFTNASEDIQDAKEIVRKVIYEYGMSETFDVSTQEESELLAHSVSDVTTLLNTLEKALKETARHLLMYENITIDECRDILRNIF